MNLSGAERAVHLSGALTQKVDLPSSPLLETVCATRLDSSLHHALRQIVDWLATIKPNPFASVAELIDEVYLIMSSLLHYHYIENGGGSFGERFYGLTRNKLDGSLMNEGDRMRSLLWLTAVPYICNKLTKKLDRYRLQLADGVLYNDFERRIKSLTCWLCGVSGALLGCLRVYDLTSGNGTPELRLQKLSLGSSGVQGEPAVGVQALAFAAQLMSQMSLDLNGNTTISEIPPPPDYHPRSKDLVGKCALCLQTPVSPTAIATSGYVFCFSCIMHRVHASKEATCPITNVPISLQHLVRIYHVNTSL